MDKLTIEELPGFLIDLGQEFKDDNENVTYILTVTALVLKSAKDQELRQVLSEFVKDNAAFFDSERAKEIRKTFTVVK